MLCAPEHPYSEKNAHRNANNYVNNEIGHNGAYTFSVVYDIFTIIITI